MTIPEKFHQQLVKLNTFHEKFKDADSPDEAHKNISQLNDLLKWVQTIRKQLKVKIVEFQKHIDSHEKQSTLKKLFTRNKDNGKQQLQQYELELQFAEMIQFSVTEVTLPRLKALIVRDKNAGIPPVNYQKYIRSVEWKKKAEEAKANAGNCCQICNKSRAEVQLDAHHRTYERLGNEHPQDITILCRECHQLYESNKNEKMPATKKCRTCGNSFTPLADTHKFCVHCYLAPKPTKKKQPAPSQPSAKEKQGFCIRCKTEITLDPLYPYCYACFRSWKRYENDNYRERVCHICRKSHDTTRLKPACYNCYLDTKKTLRF